MSKLLTQVVTFVTEPMPDDPAGVPDERFVAPVAGYYTFGSRRTRLPEIIGRCESCNGLHSDCGDA